MNNYPAQERNNMLSPQAQMIRDALHSGLSKEDLHDRIDHLQPFFGEAKQSLDDDHKRLKFEYGVIEDIHEWLSLEEIVLQKNMCSRVHKLIESLHKNKVVNKSGDGVLYPKISSDKFSTAHIFVVQHDWAAAIGPAIESDDVLLPYNSCVFEFMISGKCVIVFAVQIEGEQPVALPFVETSTGWLCGYYDKNGEGPLYLVWQQIVAICVALDAEVATSEVIRAPISLNKKRERNGKPPLKDFHIVDLSKRHRMAGPAVGTHRSPRLHFRRGHWRHLGEFKTWIRWMLVGDPDLGFIEKHYHV